jgi:hypothetical protein
MAERIAQRSFTYEGAAGRYRALIVKTCDPARRRMLEEMIARELESAKGRRFFASLMNKKWLGSGDAESV